MSKPINVFRVPLGPATEPGLSTMQLEKRSREARHMIRAIMPTTRSLMHSVLTERIISSNGLFWLAFDLEDSPQLPLFNRSSHPTGKRIASALTNLYAELARLREEAESSAIRVGELSVLASELDSLPVDEARVALGDLSADELQLWRLIHRRNGEQLAIEFEDGRVNLPLPTLGAIIPEGRVRKIQFRVRCPSKRQAKLIGIKENSIHEAGEKTYRPCPQTITLLRSPETDGARCEAWFLLYVAEYRKLVVEATVRMALKRLDYSPSHLELLEVINQGNLKVELAGIIFGKPSGTQNPHQQ